MTGHISAIEKMAEENIRKWITATHARERLTEGPLRDNVGPYIAVSRETGAGGSAIAHRVAEKLAWDVLDKQIVDYLASRYQTPRSLVEFADEKQISWIEDTFSSWIENQQFTSATYTYRLAHLLLLAAYHGNVVIVGRGARFILPRARGVSVRILAPLDFRIEQVLLREGVSAKVARQMIEDSDRQREVFVKKHFRVDASDPHRYDLVINVGKLVKEDAADLIVDAARSWMKKSGVSIAKS